jgi:uncharacterized protein YggE
MPISCCSTLLLMDHTTYKKALYGTTIFALVILSIAALSYANSYAQSFSPESGWNTLTVSAEGKATGIPDVAQVTFSVTTEGKDAATAQGDTIKKMDDITTYLLDKGVEKKDIQTTGYNVYPRETYNCTNRMVPCNPTIIGYTVSQQVTVKIREVAKAGEILGEVVTKGATNVSGPTFVIDDASELEDEARAEAIDKAKERARTIARQSGIKLGKLIGVSDDGSGPMPYAMDGRGGAEMDMMVKNQAAPAMPNIQPGSQEVFKTVTLTYSIR